ncbi:MAG: hypothetical protein IKZ87_04645 [Actinomycetaceae bacterium]|nr:hypothetical protein [Actinomycetaceae bacterium]
MKEIFCERSTNGRWGVSIVSHDFDEIKYGQAVQATVTKLGRIEGRDVLRLDKTDKPQWVLVLGDSKPLAGASVALGMGLQSGSYVTVLLLSETAIVKTYGYKGRSSSVTFYQKGERANIPASVLLALGLVEGKEEPEEVPPPPAFEEAFVCEETRSALAEALITAGLAH